MTLSISIATCLIAMRNGEKIALSKLKHPVVDAMIENGILRKRILGRSKALIYLEDKERLNSYIANHLGIECLDNYLEGLKREDLTRAEAVDMSSNSKLKRTRTFKGFLVNCLEPIECILDGQPFVIQPREGTFTFIYDFINFLPPNDYTIVGIENPFNFRYVQKQRKLFEGIQPLFVSRYPQSKDLINWLQAIPNRYLHFGDFDFSGLNIYINEYKRYLQEKAHLFLLPEVEQLLKTKGNMDNYNKQAIFFDKTEIKEKNVLILLKWIEKSKKGLEQEIFAK